MAAVLVRETKCALDLLLQHVVVVVSSLQRHDGVRGSSSARESFRAGCLWETHYCLTNRPAGLREVADFIENNSSHPINFLASTLLRRHKTPFQTGSNK